MIAGVSAMAVPLLLFSLAAAAQQPNPAQPSSNHAPRIVASMRFSTTVSLPRANGRPQPFQLSQGSLWLSGGRQIEVPARGFYVATLVSSDIVTVIGGQQETRHTGDSWSVPAGSPMIVRLQGRSEGALLDIFNVEPNPATR
jgi:hypothetical protein